MQKEGVSHRAWRPPLQVAGCLTRTAWAFNRGVGGRNAAFHGRSWGSGNMNGVCKPPSERVQPGSY